MDIKLLELYSDYIISSFGQITATGLSKALGGSLSHDKITRFLSQKELDSKQLWKLVKPVVREQENMVFIRQDLEKHFIMAIKSPKAIVLNVKFNWSFSAIAIN